MITNRNLKVIFNKSEIGAGTRGAGLGADAIVVASISKGSRFFKEHPSVTINDLNHILTEEITHNWAKRIDSMVTIYKEVCHTISQSLKEGEFPLVIAGDHGSAGGTVSGIKHAYPEKRLGIIWIDAHADLHSPYTSPSGNVHGMPVAAILNEDNKRFDPGDVKEETVLQWEKLKAVGVAGPKARPDDVVFIGVRDTEKEEDFLMEHHGIPNYQTAWLRERGIDEVVGEILNEKLKDCDLIYISFDVDSLDSELVSAGTGTPVKGGLLVDEAMQILEKLLASEKVCCLEITEVNPLLDKGNKMAEHAFDIISHLFE